MVYREPKSDNSVTFKAAWALLQPLIVNGQEVKARAILARACNEKPEPEKKKRERPKKVNGVKTEQADHGAYLPSEEEIVKGTQAVQEKWDASTKRSRLVTDGVVHADTPTVNVSQFEVRRYVKPPIRI